MEAGNEGVEEHIRELGNIAQHASDLLAGGGDPSLERLAGMTELAQSVLRRLNLSSSEQDYLLEEGIKRGAWAGKLSGAGGGGAFFLLVPHWQGALRVAEHLKSCARRSGIPTAGTIKAIPAGMLLPNPCDTVAGLTTDG
jgi:mevalonate kinase